ncbi:chorismate mutase [Bacillus massiliigorillae]|uniref:chorismate mutase n=1 Tax=Bacillus massiliigorillae TaxID=1243664 RepID=UPI0003A8352B|nr:chorismate mutase [Bacillus massiliigorillae]
MKRMSYERPTDYYDERLLPIDEQICALLQQRKEVSKNNPGFPEDEIISEWSKKYNLYEDFLKSLFSTMLSDSIFKPQVEPTVFRKHIPILKSKELDETIYTISYVKQYSNASILTLYADWYEEEEEDPYLRMRNRRESHFELSISDEFDCRWEGGGGGSGHFVHNYVISPPLPDNPKGLSFVFEEVDQPFMGAVTGQELVFKME